MIAPPITDRALWEQWRRSGLGGSDIPIILGLTSWSTPGEIWASKLDTAAPTVVTERMQWGNLLENQIIDEWARRHDLDVPADHRQVRAIDEAHPWRIATIDGHTPDLIIEAKNTSLRPWDEPPAHYVAQVTWQLGNAGADRAVIVALHQGVELVEYPIDFDPELYDLIAARADEFWGHVVAERHPTDALQADPQLIELARGHEALRSARLEYEKKEKAAKATLILWLDGHTEAHVGGQALVTHRSVPRTGLDADALVEAYATATSTDPQTVRDLFTTHTSSPRLNVVAKTLKELTT